MADAKREIARLKFHRQRDIERAEVRKGLGDLMGRVQDLLALLTPEQFAAAVGLFANVYEISGEPGSTVPYDRDRHQDPTRTAGVGDHVVVVKPFIATRGTERRIKAEVIGVAASPD